MTEILATEATLSTLKVEIKALTVSGKQMTLAVFRQLPTTAALARDWKLRQGVAYWGIVRYTVKDEGDIWAVVERNGKLYRARLTADFHHDLRRQWPDVPQDLGDAYRAAKDEERWQHGGYEYWGTEIMIFDKLFRAWEKEDFARSSARFCELYLLYRQSFDTAVQSLFALPQLFIAV
jgi:hypothetical protein